jgi:hypothetical protein
MSALAIMRKIEFVLNPNSWIADNSTEMRNEDQPPVQSDELSRLRPCILRLLNIFGDHDGCVRVLRCVVDSASIARGANSRSPIPHLSVGL